VKVVVTVEVEATWRDTGLGDPRPGDPLFDRVLGSVARAVDNALEHAFESGFHHDLETALCLAVGRVTARAAGRERPAPAGRRAGPLPPAVPGVPASRQAE
jgi:hypothetical protein